MSLELCACVRRLKRTKKQQQKTLEIKPVMQTLLCKHCLLCVSFMYRGYFP